MNNANIIRAWKNKKFAASLRSSGIAAPANPAGSASVSLKDFNTNPMITSPLCTIGPFCPTNQSPEC